MTIPSTERAVRLMHAALVEQECRNLGEAERLYREALEILPDAPDALHMLGVIRYEKGDYDHALALITRALDLTDWKFAAYRKNLGLVLGKVNRELVNPVAENRRREYREWLRKTGPQGMPSETPKVSVIVPSYNHESYIERALESVFEQTYRNVEIVVIDDGSQDGSCEIIRRILNHSPFASRFVARENRGAPATINEAIALSTGKFINVLNSDDWFHSERLETMLREVVGREAEWGFSALTMVDESEHAVDPFANARAYNLYCKMANIPFKDSVGFALLSDNVAVSSGNLFISRELIENLGGFRPYRYNHDWDFCLRALWRSEPVFVPEPLYGYRLHASNTIAESAKGPRNEANPILAQYLERALDPEAESGPFTPSVARWGSWFLVEILDSGLSELVDPTVLRPVVAGAARPSKFYGASE